MSDATLVVVHSFGSRPEADMSVSALEAAGIDAIIQADTSGGMRPHLAWAGAGFQVLVREEDLGDARNILELPARSS
jgi:Putative prokaryotic signal transducing protein